MMLMDYPSTGVLKTCLVLALYLCNKVSIDAVGTPCVEMAPLPSLWTFTSFEAGNLSDLVPGFSLLCAWWA